MWSRCTRTRRRENGAPGSHSAYAGLFRKCLQLAIKVLAVTQARVFVVPGLQQRFHISVHTQKGVGPERNPAFQLAVFQILYGRLEYLAASNDQFKLAILAAKARQYAATRLADRLHRKPARLPFRGDSMFAKPAGPAFPASEGGHAPSPMILISRCFLSMC